MELKTKLYINGKWCDGEGTLDVIDPSDESVIAQISTAGEKDADAALDAAHKVFATWSKTSPLYSLPLLVRCRNAYFTSI
jgi:acyl-CoA reductase-like NAD-dependent aldehyde dehydrogenase